MIKTILFDMGGVLFVQDTEEAFRRFTEIGINANDFIGVYGQKGLFLELENGTIDDETFRVELSKLAGRELSWEQVQHCWLGFIKGVDMDRLANLEQLRRDYRLCLASNTNPFIMDFTRSHAYADGAGIGDFLDKLYCSYEMGECKPDEAFFRKILAEENVNPQEVIFVDDSKKNIAAAEKLGIHGLWVESNSDWMPKLEALLKSFS